MKTLIDIKEVAKTMTREEFVEEASKPYSDKLKKSVTCPYEYSLKVEKRCCMWSSRCKECWSNAVKNIKFKDDMEVEKVKNLNIIEAMKMPIGTQFNVWGNQGYCEGQTIIYEAPNDNCDSKQMYWIKSDKPVIIGDYSLSISFMPIQKPVSFMEVVNSFRRCRVEHEFVEKNFGLEFRSFIAVMTALSNNLDSIGIKKVIKEGKWYIEESEDDSNDIR